jgi:hypothetical protein
LREFDDHRRISVTEDTLHCEEPENGLLRTQKQIQRYRWRHGCTDPHACGARLHKTKPCPSDCSRHQRACPPPCAPNCTKHASTCPERGGGGLREVGVKSRAGRRAVAIPGPLLRALESHKEAQDKERRIAAQLWEEGDWVFAQPNGRPIGPRADHDAWKSLLKAAGVRDARLHDTRHTAATMLLVLGVPIRAVMEVMGWSQMAMTTRYQHIPAELVAGIASRLRGCSGRPKRAQKRRTETATETMRAAGDPAARYRAGQMVGAVGFEPTTPRL